MKVGIIVNPIAGAANGGRTRARVALAKDVFRQCNVDGEVFITTHRHHARQLCLHCVERGAETIVAWGGDGTVNEVASELVFRKPVFGLVPGGSGNGFARELGLPRRDPKQALVIALQGGSRWIDVGELGGRLFFNVAGIGLDAHLAGIFNASLSRGVRRYVVSTARELWNYRPKHYVIGTGQSLISKTALIVALANTRQYGANVQIAPLARPDDGFLELVVVPSMPLVTMLRCAPRLLRGTIHRVPGVTMRSIRSLDIASETPHAFHVDGEVYRGADKLTAKVYPRALQIRCAAAP